MNGTGPTLLFVYGTLRRAVQAPAYSLFSDQADFFDHGSIAARMYDFGNYPGVILSSDPADRVLGELFVLRTAETTLQLLDQYEGIHGGTKPWPEQYARVQQPVLSDSHGTVTAWVYRYLLSVEGKPRIAHGDYVQHLRGRKNYRAPPIDDGAA
jgi:gamma-glutamylcyclotransferase (GGCT)/AIG2-like uncharacterized protein YtfP